MLLLPAFCCLPHRVVRLLLLSSIAAGGALVWLLLRRPDSIRFVSTLRLD